MYWSYKTEKDFTIVTEKHLKKSCKASDGWLYCFFEDNPRRAVKELQESDMGKKVFCHLDKDVHRPWRISNDPKILASLENDLSPEAGTPCENSPNVHA